MQQVIFTSGHWREGVESTHSILRFSFKKFLKILWAGIFSKDDFSGYGGDILSQNSYKPSQDPLEDVSNIFSFAVFHKLVAH